MNPQGRLEPFRAAIEPVQRLLGSHNDRGAIIKGIAVAFLGRPRFTADMDAVFLLCANDLTPLLVPTAMIVQSA